MQATLLDDSLGNRLAPLRARHLFFLQRASSLFVANEFTGRASIGGENVINERFCGQEDN